MKKNSVLAVGLMASVFTGNVSFAGSESILGSLKSVGASWLNTSQTSITEGVNDKRWEGDVTVQKAFAIWKSFTTI